MTSISPSKKDNAPAVAIWLLIILAFVFSLFRLGSHSLWLDEALTIKNATDISHLVSVLTTSEPYMWTYMLALNVWLKIGNSEFFIRLLSSIFFVASVVVFFKTWQLVYNTKVAFVSSLIYILHPFIIRYSQEVRAYSMALFFTGLSTYFFIKLVRRGHLLALFGYTLATMFLIYTHHFGLLILGAQVVFVVLNLKRLGFVNKVWLGVGGVFVASYPLLAIKIPQSAVNWIPDLGESGLMHFLMSLGGGNFVSLLTLTLSFFAGSWYVLTKHVKNQGGRINFEVLPVFLFFVPLVLTLAYSLLVQPAFVSRYLIIVIPAFIVLVSYTLVRLTVAKGMLVGFIILGSLAWSLLVWYGFRLPKEGSWEKTILGSHEDWRSATNFVASNAQAGDSVVFYSYYVRVPFEYYLGRLGYTDRFFLPELAVKSYTLGGVMPEASGELLSGLLPKRNGDVWLVLSHHTNSRLGRTKQAEKIKEVLANNYDGRFEGDYGGILIYRYVKK